MPVVEHAVIAAAGLGSRLGLGKPKCLVEVAGRPIIHHQLNLLWDVPDVRVVVGFDEIAVMDAVTTIRRDVIFVRNPAYRTTTTLNSYAQGARHLTDHCLYMDADVLFERESFEAFLSACSGREHLVAVTAAKTSDAVFVHRNGSDIVRFSRTDRTDFEWANLCWLPPRYCERGEGAVFERLSQDLPLPSREIVSWEIDTSEDFAAAMRSLDMLDLGHSDDRHASRAAVLK